jgi:UDPglucose 6-dehydrogenase
MKVAIFGRGNVGLATDRTLEANADFHDPAKGYVIEYFSSYDIVFICVSSLVRDPHDHDAITECLGTLARQNYTGIVAVRCTVSPTYLHTMQAFYPLLRIVHFPEFMKQRSDVYLDEPWILVLGGKEKDARELGEYLIEQGYGTRDQLLYTTLIESGLIKLYQNAGLAMKVTYANLIYEACDMFGADYNTVRRGVIADVRVGPGHMNVPGEDGFGFAGHCLPKDMKCLNGSVANRGFWAKILEINKQLRDKNV